MLSANTESDITISNADIISIIGRLLFGYSKWFVILRRDEPLSKFGFLPAKPPEDRRRPCFFGLWMDDSAGHADSTPIQNNS